MVVHAVSRCRCPGRLPHLRAQLALELQRLYRVWVFMFRVLGVDVVHSSIC